VLSFQALRSHCPECEGVRGAAPRTPRTTSHSPGCELKSMQGNVLRPPRTLLAIQGRRISESGRREGSAAEAELEWRGSPPLAATSGTGATVAELPAAHYPRREPGTRREAVGTGWEPEAPWQRSCTLLAVRQQKRRRLADTARGAIRECGEHDAAAGTFIRLLRFKGKRAPEEGNRSTPHIMSYNYHLFSSGTRVGRTSPGFFLANLKDPHCR
jgi:hypothetical protein